MNKNKTKIAIHALMATGLVVALLPMVAHGATQSSQKTLSDRPLNAWWRLNGGVIHVGRCKSTYCAALMLSFNGGEGSTQVAGSEISESQLMLHVSTGWFSSRNIPYTQLESIKEKGATSRYTIALTNGKILVTHHRPTFEVRGHNGRPVPGTAVVTGIHYHWAAVGPKGRLLSAGANRILKLDAPPTTLERLVVVHGKQRFVPRVVAGLKSLVVLRGNAAREGRQGVAAHLAQSTARAEERLRVHLQRKRRRRARLEAERWQLLGSGKCQQWNGAYPNLFDAEVCGGVFHPSDFGG